VATEGGPGVPASGNLITIRKYFLFVLKSPFVIKLTCVKFCRKVNVAANRKRTRLGRCGWFPWDFVVIIGRPVLLRELPPALVQVSTRLLLVAFVLWQPNFMVACVSFSFSQVSAV
jgi:hypothetical protein